MKSMLYSLLPWKIIYIYIYIAVLLRMLYIYIHIFTHWRSSLCVRPWGLRWLVEQWIVRLTVFRFFRRMAKVFLWYHTGWGPPVISWFMNHYSPN